MTAPQTSRRSVDPAEREAELPGAVHETNCAVEQREGDARAPWVFSVSGMDCASCARTIEAGVSRLPGVERASVSFGSGTMTVDPSANGHVSEQTIMTAVERAGYTATLRESRRSLPVTAWWRVRRTQLTLLAIAFWLAGFLIERLDGPEAAGRAFYLTAMVLVGLPVLRAAWFALKARRADMNVLMSIAAIGAVAIGEWSEGSSVLLLFSIGLLLQSMTLERTQRAIDALLKLAPDVATVRRDGRNVQVPIEATRPGDVAIVRPGERIPVDGEVLSGFSSVNQASITGESTPVEVEPGADVFAGTINGEGLIEVRSTRRAADSTLARIIHMVEEAQASRAPSQAFVDRFAAIYTPIVVGAAILLAIVGPLITGDVREWVFKALVLLVVSCPCALVISTPVALVSAIGSASRRGVLFKGGAAVEQLARVRAVAFDKTGTLTLGWPEVTDVIALNGWPKGRILEAAAAVEEGAKHPLGEGIMRAADDLGLDRLAVTEARSLPGRGAEAVVNGELLRVGSRRMFEPLPAHRQRLPQPPRAAPRSRDRR